ncbi:sensor domain-containing protein [Streptomyces tubbatahanensis]|uniref:histidine kinase n=1 Tax=Streptomyces tubbatahanensis TaxID=2923272 RepID=A0ABY3XV63_9ACTN|nr:sensor histidine kinase [Streptomyces tubbatahanensis]UNS98383.1 sensor domain-containing protein [Streptomyces tubbatahanensis]
MTTVTTVTPLPRPWWLALLRAPLARQSMRELTYVATGLPLACIAFCYAFGALAFGAALLITFVGLPVLAAGLAGCRALGHLERARARGLLELDVREPEPVRTLRRSSGVMSWIGALLRSGVSWRHLLYALLHLPWSFFSCLAAGASLCAGWGLLTYPAWEWLFPRYADRPALQVGTDGIVLGSRRLAHARALDGPVELAVVAGCGLLVVLLTPWLVRGLVQVDKVLVGGLLGPSWLAARVTELETDRGVVVDTAAADLRRIERDLHDGAQARLVSLAMGLGMAKEKLGEDPRGAATVVEEAHQEVKLALGELRDLARGIHPAILTDRGLGPALSAVAARCTVPVAVTVELPQRPAAAIEGIAYFTVSELLQNISKHSGARHASVEIWRSGERLLLQVTDDGRGGASVAAGSGLAGLADRLSAVDGLLMVHSPAGGPTAVTAELPWR